MLIHSYIKGHKDHPHVLTDEQRAALEKTARVSSEENELVRILHALSHPTKLRIYLLLRNVREISVTDVTLILHLTQSAVSHALADLKREGLVESHRCGQLICYSLSPGHKEIETLINWYKRINGVETSR